MAKQKSNYSIIKIPLLGIFYLYFFLCSNNYQKEVILPKTEYTIAHRWSGIMGMGSSKRPIVEQLSTHVYCGVRLGGMGVAIGSLIGQELADLVK